MNLRSTLALVLLQETRFSFRKLFFSRIITFRFHPLSRGRQLPSLGSARSHQRAASNAKPSACPHALPRTVARLSVDSGARKRRRLLPRFVTDLNRARNIYLCSWCLYSPIWTLLWVWVSSTSQVNCFMFSLDLIARSGITFSVFIFTTLDIALAWVSSTSQVHYFMFSLDSLFSVPSPPPSPFPPPPSLFPARMQATAPRCSRSGRSRLFTSWSTRSSSVSQQERAR